MRTLCLRGDICLGREQSEEVELHEVIIQVHIL